MCKIPEPSIAAENFYIFPPDFLSVIIFLIMIEKILCLQVGITSLCIYSGNKRLSSCCHIDFISIFSTPGNILWLLCFLHNFSFLLLECPQLDTFYLFLVHLNSLCQWYSLSQILFLFSLHFIGHYLSV